METKTETSKELKSIEDAIDKYNLKHGKKACIVTNVKAFDNDDLVNERLLVTGDKDGLFSMWFDTFHTLNTDNYDTSWDVEEVLDEFEEEDNSEEVIGIVNALCGYYEKYGENTCIICHVSALDDDGDAEDEMFLIVGNKERLVKMNQEIMDSLEDR